MEGTGAAEETVKPQPQSILGGVFVGEYGVKPRLFRMGALAVGQMYELFVSERGSVAWLL